MDLIAVKNKLIENIEKDDFRGWDPYDILESGYISRNSNRRILLFLTQLNRLSPVNLRKILGIRKIYNSKANGLLLSSFLNLEHHRSKIDFLVKWLADNKSEKFDGYSIGFTHDIVLKNYISFLNHPSTIITLFVMYAFIEYFRETDDQEILNLIISFEKLIDEKLPSRETPDSLWYSYNFEKMNEIYNSTAKIGKFYSLLHGIRPREELKVKIGKILNYLAKKQREDGTWAYGRKIKYTDGFHTAFILEAIWYMRKLVDNEKYERMFEKGTEQYRKTMFRENGQPLYFHPEYRPSDIRKYLIQTDIRDCAMAVVFFSKTGELETAGQVLEWTINSMYDGEGGYFYYYKNPLMTNRIRFIRWQAWMLYAISEYSIR
ncbi:MAG: hypothetical protein GF417_05110 [Candidatus Latescibacteria bacterium]|nr:hypothetical protein [Candidatus Latescibacterota bacterium]